MKEFKISRKFHKPTSMFKDWTEETPAIMKKGLKIDMEHSKIGRFVKDYFDY